MGKYCVMLLACVSCAVYGADCHVYSSYELHYLGNLYASDYSPSSKLYAPTGMYASSETDKKGLSDEKRRLLDYDLRKFALREKLYMFQTNKEIVSKHLAEHLPDMPQHERVVGYLTTHCTGAKKTSWEIDHVVEIAFNHALAYTKPPMNRVDRGEWMRCIKNVLMRLAARVR